MGRKFTPRYRRPSSGKKNSLKGLGVEARKRIVNTLGYDPFNGKPKRSFGSS